MPADGIGLDVTVIKLGSALSAPYFLNMVDFGCFKSQAEEDDVPGGYLIGYPLGLDVAITLGPARFTERYSHFNNARDAQFVRYTTLTQDGHSGGPVFDKYWRVVAMHQEGEVDRTATSQIAARGVTLSTIRDAIETRTTTSSAPT